MRGCVHGTGQEKRKTQRVFSPRERLIEWRFQNEDPKTSVRTNVTTHHVETSFLSGTAENTTRMINSLRFLASVPIRGKDSVI